MPIFAFSKKKKPSPADVLRNTKATLTEWIAEAQSELQIPAEPGEFAYWHLDANDEILTCTAQVKLVEWLENHAECWTAAALEDQLRTRFRRLDEIGAALAVLPAFDEDEDELDYTTMDKNEQAQRQQVEALDDEHFLLDRECDLLANFLGIPDRRLYDARHILGAYHEDEELRKLTKKEEAATYYSLLKAWIDGTAGTLKGLPIPTHFSDWMSEHSPRFSRLV